MGNANDVAATGEVEEQETQLAIPDGVSSQPVHNDGENDKRKGRERKRKVEDNHKKGKARRKREAIQEEQRRLNDDL